MKKIFAAVLCVLMLVSIMPIQAHAVWADTAVINVTATEPDENGSVQVSININTQETIGAYGLGMEYNSDIYEVDENAGDLEVGRGPSAHKIGLSFSSDDEYFEVTANFQYNYNRLKAESGKKIFFITDASAYGVTSKGMTVTFFFKLKDGVNADGFGTNAEFKLTNEKAGNTGLFLITNLIYDTVPYPTENNAVTVWLPIEKVPVTGKLATPAKGASDTSNLTSKNKNVNIDVTWSPALTDGKFAASTEYTATVTVKPVEGASFAPDAAVTYTGSDLTFVRNSDGTAYTATKTFPATADKALTDMTITKQPTKVSGYVDGDKFDTAGMTVKATYDDGSVDNNYTKYTVEPETLSKGDTKVTVISSEDTSFKQEINITAVEGRADFSKEFTPAEVSADYTGSDLAKTLTDKLDKGGITGTVTYSFKRGDTNVTEVVNVGKYDIYATVAGDGHYNDGTMKVASATVNPKKVAPSVTAIPDQDYTGEQIKPQVTVTPDTLKAGADYTVTYGANKNVEDGGTVTLKPVSGSNYTFDEVTAKFKIAPRPVELSWSKSDLTYTGKEQSVTAKVANLVDGDKVGLTYDGNKATDAGSYTAKVTAIDNTNYTLTGGKNVSHKWTIGKADYDGTITDSAIVSSKGTENKEYNISSLQLPAGFTNAKIVKAQVDGTVVTKAEVSADGQSVIYSTAEAKDGDKGTVTLTISSKNYNDHDAVLTVTAKDLVIPSDVWDNVEVAKTVEYGTSNSGAVTLKAETATIKDLNGNPVTGKFVVKSPDAIYNAGDATVTVTFIITDEGDYKDISEDKIYSYTVTAKEVPVVWENTELTYNGEDQLPTARAEGVNGENLVLTVSGAKANAGEYTATAELTGVNGGGARTGNYRLTNASTKYTIAKKEVTVSNITAADKVYDGTTDVTLDTAKAVITGKLDKDTLTVTAKGAFADANAGVNKTVNITEIIITGNDNYVTAARGQQTSTTATINPKVVTFTVELDRTTLEYTGEEQIPNVTVKDGSTVLTADKDYTVKFEDSSLAAKTGYTVTVTGIGNYAGSTGAATYDIVALAPSFNGAPTYAEKSGNVLVSWSVRDNGAPITGIVVAVKTAEEEDRVFELDGTATELLVEEIKRGVEYTVTVTAENSIGVTVSEPLVIKLAEYIDNPSVFAVNVTSSGNGKITASCNYASVGTTVVVTATPNEGYVLASLTAIDSRGNDIKVEGSNGKYIFKMPGANVTVKAVFKQGGKFTDVAPGSYYEDAIYWAVSNGIAEPESEYLFKPEAISTRADFVTYLWKAMGSPEPNSTETPFVDVVEGSYYYKAVLWATENGITTGVSETEFSPDMSVTRAQMVTFIYRLADVKGTYTVLPFVDVARDTWYTDAVMWAAAEGVTEGTSETEFSPDVICTKGVTLTFLYRYFK